MSDPRNVFEDLVAETEVVDTWLAGLEPHQWELPTPAEGWTVADQLAHLTFVFWLAKTAATDPATFQALAEHAGQNFDAAVNAALAGFRGEPEEMLQRWRAERSACVAALVAKPASELVPWLVRPIPAAVLACAGIMEVFAHGQDIADTLGVRREPTDRLEHLVAFAALVRDFGYQARGLTPPAEEFRFEISSPSGEQVWTFGPADAEQKVTGPAEDFCLLVTRRRHRDDLAVVASGEEAERWLDIAQAYRGPAGPGRRPGQFAEADSQLVR